MSGNPAVTEPMSVFLPDVQGKMAVEKVSAILRRGRTELITAAGNYVDNVHVGGVSSGDVEVGIKPALASAVNGEGMFDSDNSDPAVLIKDTVSHMKALVEPVIKEFDEIAGARTVGGSVDEMESQIEGLLQRLLVEENMDTAKQIAAEVKKLISTEAGQIRSDAGMMDGESVKVEKGLGEEKEAYDRRSQELGEGFDSYRENLQWQRRALSSVEDAAIRKGEPLRQKCRQVVEEVEGVEEVWQQFLDKFFVPAQ